MSSMLRARYIAVQCARASLATARPKANAVNSTISLSAIRTFADGASSNKAADIPATSAVDPLLTEPGASMTPSDRKAVDEVPDVVKERIMMEAAAGRLVSTIRRIRHSNDPHVGGELITLLDDARRDGILVVAAHNMAVKWFAVNNPDKTLEILGQMKEEGPPPDIRTYNCAISSYASRYDLPRVEALYQELLGAGLTPDRLTYSLLIVANSRTRQSECYRVWQVMQEKEWRATRAAYLSLITCFRKDKRDQDVLYVLDRMRRERSKPSKMALLTGIRCAVTQGLPDVAESLFRYHDVIGASPNDDAYKSMMHVYLKARKHEEALAYWRLLVSNDGIRDVVVSFEVCSLALGVACREAQWDEVEAILDFMQSRNFLRAEAMFGFLFKRDIGSVRHLEWVHQMWGMLVDRGLKPTPDQVLQMALALAKRHKGKEAARLFQAAHDQGAVMTIDQYEAWVTADMMNRKADAMRVWELAKAKTGQAGSPQLFARMMKMRGGNDPDAIIDILNDAKQAGKAERLVYDTAIVQLCAGGSLHVARGLIREMWQSTDRAVHPGDNTYNQMVLACEAHNDTRLALALLHEMGATTPARRPAREVVPFLIKALLAHDRAPEVIPLCENLRTAGIQLPNVAYPQVAQVCYDLQDREKCRYFVSQALLKRQVVSPEVQAYGRQDRRVAATFSPPQPPARPTGEKVHPGAYAKPSNASEGLDTYTAVPAAQRDRSTSSSPGESSETCTTMPAAGGDGSSSSLPRGDNDIPTTQHTQEEAFCAAENVEGDLSGDGVTEAMAGRDDVVSSSAGGESKASPDRGTEVYSLLGGTSSTAEVEKDETCSHRNDGSSCENNKSDEEPEEKPEGKSEEKSEEGGRGQSTIARIGSFVGRLFGR